MVSVLKVQACCCVTRSLGIGRVVDATLDTLYRVADKHVKVHYTIKTDLKRHLCTHRMVSTITLSKLISNVTCVHTEWFHPPPPLPPLPPSPLHRDNFSPPVLIYDTPVVLFRSVLFTDNHPSELPPSITHDTCYFSGGQDVFFLDNRTSSGGISFYVEDWPTRFLIQDCVFLNNSARPDPDVSLPRRSGSYGHGGALNIRLLNSSGSSVCIENSVFEFNYAEAHAGALAIAVAGESSLNAFYVRNATFERNRCVIDNCTGGAVGIDLFAGTSFNKFEFTDSRFTRNKAQVSGAISLATLVSATPNADGISDILILLRCSFERNEAFFEGTALGAYSLTHTNQIGIPVNITDW